MKARLSSTLALLGALVALLHVSVAAGAQFTDPVPTLEQARGEAAARDRLLVLVFSTNWCGPCQQLTRDLRRPAASRLPPAHVVIYDADIGEGAALATRLSVRSYPTLVALDRAGQEVRRHGGYDGLTALGIWLREAVAAAVPLADALAAAEQVPGDGFRQLAAARRLMAAGREPEARRRFEQAVAAGPAAASAAAAWALAKLDHDAETGAAAERRLVEIAHRFPGTVEGDDALVALARRRRPHALASLLRVRIAGETKAPALRRLALAALRAGALPEAQMAAGRLAEYDATAPESLRIRAAIALQSGGEGTEAATLLEQAIPQSKADLRDELLDDLEQIRRGKRGLGRVLQSLQAPTLLSEPDESFHVPLWVSQRKQLEQALSERCAAAAPAKPQLRVIVLSGDGPASHRVIFAPMTPAALVACVRRVVASTTISPGRSWALALFLTPPDQRDAIAEAADAAEVRCRSLADGEHPIDLVVSGAPGAPVQVTLSRGAVALRRCVERSFAGMASSVALLETRRMRFSRPAE